MVELHIGRGRHAEHFEDLPTQAHAAHFGMWVFLASEVLLFGALFALYATYRDMFPDPFAFGVSHNPRVLGSVNTLVLLTSSFTIAWSTLLLRDGRRTLTVALVLVTIALGLAFLVIKGIEYAQHYEEGIEIDGTGRFLREHPIRGLPVFFFLYYLMTGLHALHVTAGLLVLAWLAFKIQRAELAPPHHYPLGLGAIYWHLVDVVWIFLWPLYYLTGGGGS